MIYYDLFVNDQYQGQYRLKKDAISDAESCLSFIEGDHDFDINNPDTISIARCEDTDYIDTIYERTRVGDEKWKNTLNK